ncbi:MAG: hypothetical protein ACFBZ9_10885 [Sphingomonadales bacterium]
MNKALRGLVAATAMNMATASMAQAQDRHVVIGLDLSSSTPLTSDMAYAARASASVNELLAGLEPGDRVSVRSVGDYGVTANKLNFDLVVSRRIPVIKVRRTVGQLISNLPRLTGTEKLPVAQSTNLIGFLELESYSVECSIQSTEFLLLTDGVEWSPSTNGNDLAAGTATLPQPETENLKGCGLTMLGIGQLQSSSTPATTNNLIKAWREWAENVGMTFTPKPGL